MSILDKANARSLSYRIGEALAGVNLLERSATDIMRLVLPVVTNYVKDETRFMPFSQLFVGGLYIQRIGENRVMFWSQKINSTEARYRTSVMEAICYGDAYVVHPDQLVEVLA